MNRLRWVAEGDIWDLDMSTPVTLEATARAVSDDPLPLGVSRGTHLSRSKQVEFFHRFMAAPLIPSFSSIRSNTGDGGGDGGFSLQRVLTLPFSNNWFVSLLGQFNVQRFVSEVKKNEAFGRRASSTAASRLNAIGKHLKDKSLYALGFCSELLLTPDDTLLLSYDTYKGDLKKTPRAKAIFNHKFPLHNLTAEAFWPGLFVDKHGEYWDVPLSMAIDLASLPAESGLSYHLCLHHNSGSPKKFNSDTMEVPPPSLLPGLSLKSAVSYRSNMDLWRGTTPKLETCKPFDIFLSSPHVAVSGIIGSVMTAAYGENSIRSKFENDSEGVGGFSLHIPSVNSGFMADALGRASLTAQYGSFQKNFFDLTRFHARLDFPHGLRFLTGATSVAQDLLNSRQPSLEAFQKICPEVLVSLQQQIVGPFSFRVESGIQIDLKNGATPVTVDKTVFAMEYAIQVLASAKAVAWFSPQQKEIMVELRFFET
ncbi:PREDICTED: protein TRIGALACTOSYLDIACYLGLYCEROL 4, chloroplastic-like isoform X2 [Camelina sativa]|uniref:Protein TRIGALACTOSYLDIACYLGLYCEROL 4, chloroplastic-like isoform X1 n=1 Tax=Camelina sativa TaxID=90675 RepID=A0ABM0XHV5_CAMSA|nr:PREDICTED: protein TRIGALACTOSYLDIACYLGLYCEROL 4, chloroplastic-like isoform X3 [Camelina sativa]XP_019097062.1 PREDICTED: protein TRIGALACTOSYLDIACYLGLYCEROL 4, chloroplastic-like isoform X1 [Camelina sativa]XP_019097063.1 PREDICTED: protein TRIGALACTOSYLDIACYLGLYCEROL 4, chloroplastic-like isoform X2 [Camelina sativa]